MMKSAGADGIKKQIFHRFERRRKRETKRRTEDPLGRMTGLTGRQPAGCSQLQFLDLLDQQGDVLQQVGVLLQQPLHSRLSVSSSVHLHRQLLLENVDLSRTVGILSKTKQ